MTEQKDRTLRLDQLASGAKRLGLDKSFSMRFKDAHLSAATDVEPRRLRA